MTRAPHCQGHWWGRWHTPRDGTDDDGLPCMQAVWEVHQIADLGSLDQPALFALVPGVRRPQLLSGFEWGPQAKPPKAVRTRGGKAFGA